MLNLSFHRQTATLANKEYFQQVLQVVEIDMKPLFTEMTGEKAVYNIRMQMDY